MDLWHDGPLPPRGERGGDGGDHSGYGPASAGERFRQDPVEAARKVPACQTVGGGVAGKPVGMRRMFLLSCRTGASLLLSLPFPSVCFTSLSLSPHA